MSTTDSLLAGRTRNDRTSCGGRCRNDDAISPGNIHAAVIDAAWPYRIVLNASAAPWHPEGASP